MKTHHLLAVLLLFIAAIGKAQFVTIPDVNFKNYLVNNPLINTLNDGEISFIEATSYSDTINVSNLNISDLTGFGSFTAVPYLICSNNQLTLLEVSINSQLTYLKCDGNQLTNINITNNTNLEYFNIANNPITSLDVSANTALVHLVCSSTQISSLNLASNIALQELDINTTSIASIDLSANTNLTSLNIKATLLTTIDLSNNTLLLDLNCENTGLTTLDLSNNINLMFLLMNSTSLSTIDLSANTALVNLKCNSNTFTSLDLSTNIALESLECISNNLSALDLSANVALRQLLCMNNNLTTLNVQNGNNTNVTTFNAISNPSLTCIQVDNASYSTQNWTNIDATAGFSINCPTPCPQHITGYVIDNGQHPTFTANDTLQISLFQKTAADSTLWPMVDSFLIFLPNDSAFFKFSALATGTYMLKAKFLSPVAGQNYMPTFSGDSILWNTADSIVIQPCDSTPFDINIVNPYLPTGINSLGGYLYFSDFIIGKTHTNNDPIPLIDVVIEKDSLPAQYKPFTASDPISIIGYSNYLSYSFSNLPIGNYRITVGIPGIKQADIILINLNSTSIDDTLNFCIDTLGLGAIDTCFLDTLPIVTGVLSSPIASSFINLFPNPTSSSSTLEFNSPATQKGTITVNDILGRTIQSQSFQALKGNNRIPMTMGMRGIFFVNVSLGERKAILKAIIE